MQNPVAKSLRLGLAERRLAGASFSQLWSEDAAADGHGLAEGASLLVLPKVYVDAILEKRKTLGIRTPLTAGKRCIK